MTIAADRAEVVSFDRAEGWRVHDSGGLIATLELPAIDVSIPLRDIYRSTPIQ